MYLMSFLEFTLYTNVMDKSIHTPQLFSQMLETQVFTDCYMTTHSR